MPPFAPPSTSSKHNPASLSEIERDYYQTTWGFDPLAACQPLGGCKFRYEACLPLEQDVPLKVIGVFICARVDWEGKDIHNRIVFRRGETEATIECTHTVVYAGPPSNALTFADNAYAVQDQLSPKAKELTQRAGGMVTLPPWEHFAALKSYVAAIADAGVLALLDQTSANLTDASECIPFGFNAEMHAQVVDALRVFAPSFVNPSFRGFQDGITVQLYNELRQNWQAQAFANSENAPAGIPVAEVELQGNFCRYEFPHHLSGPWSGYDVPADVRRARVQQYLREVIQRYSSHETEVNEYGNPVPVDDPGEFYVALMKDWATDALEQLATASASLLPPKNKPSPPIPLRPISPAEIASIEHGNPASRCATVLTAPLPPEMQAKLAIDSDFTARLALVGNSQTTDAVLTILASDPQFCVRAATNSRLRRGTTTIEPLVGEVLDPGEIMWFFAAHPGIFFYFGVTTWGDGSPAYADWFAACLRADPRWEDAIGEGYAWMYENGEFSEYDPNNERGPSDFDFADRGWIDHACGHLPCVYLGPDGWLTGSTFLKL